MASEAAAEPYLQVSLITGGISQHPPQTSLHMERFNLGIPSRGQ